MERPDENKSHSVNKDAVYVANGVPVYSMGNGFSEQKRLEKLQRVEERKRLREEKAKDAGLQTKNSDANSSHATNDPKKISGINEIVKTDSKPLKEKPPMGPTSDKKSQATATPVHNRTNRKINSREDSRVHSSEASQAFDRPIIEFTPVREVVQEKIVSATPNNNNGRAHKLKGKFQYQSEFESDTAGPKSQKTSVDKKRLMDSPRKGPNVGVLDQANTVTNVDSFQTPVRLRKEPIGSDLSTAVTYGVTEKKNSESGKVGSGQNMKKYSKLENTIKKEKSPDLAMTLTLTLTLSEKESDGDEVLYSARRMLKNIEGTDDLYLEGNSPGEVNQNWVVQQALNHRDLVGGNHLEVKAEPTYIISGIPVTSILKTSKNHVNYSTPERSVTKRVNINAENLSPARQIIAELDSNMFEGPLEDALSAISDHMIDANEERKQKSERRQKVLQERFESETKKVSGTKTAYAGLRTKNLTAVYKMGKTNARFG